MIKSVNLNALYVQNLVHCTVDVEERKGRMRVFNKRFGSQ
jgi:hypothetical protein